MSLLKIRKGLNGLIFIGILLVSLSWMITVLVKWSRMDLIQDVSREILNTKLSSFYLIALFKKYQFGSFQSFMNEVNNAMILKMDFSLFSDQSFIKILFEKMPDLANNPDFILAIKNNTLADFLKTIDSNSKSQLLDLYNTFCKDLCGAQRTEQMRDFIKHFEYINRMAQKSIGQADWSVFTFGSVFAEISFVMFACIILSFIQISLDISVYGIKILDGKKILDSKIVPSEPVNTTIALTPFGLAHNTIGLCFGKSA